MSKIEFSNEQRLAIDAEGCNYLISAGAGSGKTAVLTERIYRFVSKTRKLDNFLILTFTNLAAMQMKEKIRDKLANDPELSYLATEVDNAHIETFDAFYLFVAKKYFYRLGIDKDVSIIDNSIVAIKYRQKIEEIFKNRIVNSDPKLMPIIEKFVLKNYSDLTDFVFNIIRFAETKSDKEEFYKALLHNYQGEKYYEFVITNKYQSLIRNINFLIDKVQSVDFSNDDDKNNILEFLKDFLSCKDYTSLVNKIDESNFPGKPRGVEEKIEERNGLREFYNKSIKGPHPSEEEIICSLKENQKYAEVFIEIALEAEEYISQFKKAHNSYSFADISRMVLKLLKEQDIKKEISYQFDYIMVDEYQDTNDIQEDVLNIIARDNVYMVGDIKQSIYRFRNADCRIFNAKFNEYKKNNGGKEIDLNKSFRSRLDIVNFINDIFSNIMTLEYNTIDYSNGHQFGFGQTAYGSKVDEDSPYKTVEYRYTFEYADECAQIESEIIAKDIIRKINSRFQVYDFDSKNYRDCDFKDFAIIIDRETQFAELMDAFSKFGIPLKNCGKEKLMVSDINVVIKNLLKMLYFALENNYQEEYKHAFVSVSRSFLIESSDQEIYNAINPKGESRVLTTPLAQKIELLKEKLRFAPLKEVLTVIYEEFDLYDKIIKITNFYANAHKAEVLLNYAEQMDKLGMSLKDLVEFFDNLKDYNLDVDYRETSRQENSVTLINIHQSKGLEYNICYYPLLNKQFNVAGLYSRYQVSSEFGLVFPNDVSALYDLYTENEKQQQFEEKIRLLYVALTRAKQKIIILNGTKESKKVTYKLPYNLKCLAEIYRLGKPKDKYYEECKFVEDDIRLEKVNNEENSDIEKIVLKEVVIPSNLIVKTRASKDNEGVDEDLLIFGTQVHAYLEGIDFSNRDTSYIKDYRYRKIVNNVVNSPLFKGVSNEQVRHEYKYYDKQNNVHGIIDCLVEFDDRIYIIDFKLKNIDEDEYDKQLRTYKKYISQISDKPITMYLLAALTGEVREVKDE